MEDPANPSNTVPNSAAPDTLNGRVWPLANNNFSEAERTAINDIGEPWLGVAISGGGSRSLSAAMGQLRGLTALGIMQKTTWLSCVSGGCWASTLYTYLPDTISDDVFLGAVQMPEQLTWHGTGHMDPQALGSVPQQLGVEVLAKKVIEFHDNHIDEDRWWARVIGEQVLKPFGLGDESDRYFTWTACWLENEILPDNPELTKNDFYVTRAGRPFLVTNATLFYPPAPTAEHQRPDKDGFPHIIESTPTGVGVPPTFSQAGAPGPQGARDIGGGWIDPFCYGGQAPDKPPVENRFSVATPKNRYKLSDAAGNSSAAFVETIVAKLSEYSWIEGLVPLYSYWPVNDAGSARNTRFNYIMGDGGNFEDTGVGSLVRRKVPKIISFINAEMPVGFDTVSNQPIVDPQLAALFGYAPKIAGEPWGLFTDDVPHSHAQVFESDQFIALIEDLWDAVKQQASAVSRQQQLRTIDNPVIGTSAGTTDIIFVMNTPVPTWTRQLEEPLKLYIEDDPLNPNFPNYDTLAQLHLSKRQVNLLADLSCWNIVATQKIGNRPANRSVFETFMAT